MKQKIKILAIDLETAPKLGFTWGDYEQNLIDTWQDGYILSFSYQWVGENKIHFKGLPNYRGFKKIEKPDHPLWHDDKRLSQELWELFNKADVIIAHNGQAFDIKKANARFLYHGFSPPAPYEQFDTLTMARKIAKFDSNKLDELARYFRIKRKIPHTGKHLWMGCMMGDKKSWKIMEKYNKNDVWILVQIYFKLRAWGTHPNVAKYEADGKVRCPVCGKSEYILKGWRYNRTTKSQAYGCVCGKRFQSKKTVPIEGLITQ